MKKTTKLGILSAALLVLTAGAYAWKFHLSPEAKVIAAVKQSLNDPYSAKFSDVEANTATGCGYGFVNAKNRMGAYVGETPFILTSDGELTFAPDSSSAANPTREELVEAIADLKAWIDLKERCFPPED